MKLFISYVVHSDSDENNVLQEFYGRGSKQQAIKYAKSWGQKDIFVEKVSRFNDFDGEVINTEIIWEGCE